MYKFEELDQKTRQYMYGEFDKEESAGNPYRSKNLSPIGLQNFHELMKNAIVNGNEMTLAQSLNNYQFWNEVDSRGRKINVQADAEMLAFTEFNTWYVRGLSRRLIDENIEYCEIYRAAPAYQPRGECTRYEGQKIEVKKVYFGHRAKYWPNSNSSAFSIPAGPNCHHTIRRINK
jgi:hypothetical protein